MKVKPQGSNIVGPCALLLLLGCLGVSESKSDPPLPVPGAEPLHRLAASELPPSTRTKPDPAKSQYLREPVHVSISEQVKNQAGVVSAPAVKVLERYLEEYLRRAGHPIVENPRDAKYEIEGSFDAQFVTVIRVLDRAAGYRYKGAASIRLLAASGVELEAYPLPELLEENVKSEDSTVLNLRRRVAKIFWDQLMFQGKTLSNPDVVLQLGLLPLQPNKDEPVTTEEVVKQLAEIGFPAVPYLIEALTDNRSVRIPASYPGLTGRSDDLRVFHIADKALEEIFQKVSRMSLDIAAEDPRSLKLRQVIVRGWEKEWRRFCKPYAESPNAPR